MAQVMPSQAVAAIVRLFPHVTTPTPGDGLLGPGQIEKLQSVLNLANEVPQELLALPSDQYAEFVFAKNHIEVFLKTYISRGTAKHLAAIDGRDVCTVLYRVLSQCQDEYPPKSTSELSFIKDDALRESLRSDLGAISRALESAEWKAANVLAGSAIEALLLWRLQETPPGPAAAAASAYKLSLSPGAPKDIHDWSLYHFIEVAADLAIIRPETSIEARLTKNYRNLIHPGRSTRLAQRCDRGTAYAAVAALEHVTRDIQ